MQMQQPGNLRASLMYLWARFPRCAGQLKALSAKKLDFPVLAYGGRVSFGDHCFQAARFPSDRASGGVIEQCGHWIFEEETEFIRAKLDTFWKAAA